MRRIDLRKAQAAGLATIRDINRQIVLNYVREREPISRAAIARESALQRSTVSAIVDALQAEGLVEEVGEGESTGGRPPRRLAKICLPCERTWRASSLVHFAPPKAPGEEAVFFFPRLDEKGAPLLALDNKELLINLTDNQANSITNFRIDVPKLVMGGKVEF